MKANAIKDAIVITASYNLGGETILETPCKDFEEYCALPNVVSFEGETCGKTGWNSDRGYACYKSGAKIARKASLHKDLATFWEDIT